MNFENHFSGKSLAAAARVKETIDLKFSLVTATPSQPFKPNGSATTNHPKWNNAETFAREFKVSRKELQGAFKYCNDKGINEYQTERKIEAACILLANCELTIKEIAFELDYHQDYFSYIFKKQTGLTPTEWQKKQWERKTALKI